MKMRFEIGKFSGSRPLAASASFRIGTEAAKSAMREPPDPIQPSARRAARRTASGWPTPIQIGGCGFCTGFGHIVSSFR